MWYLKNKREAMQEVSDAWAASRGNWILQSLKPFLLGVNLTPATPGMVACSLQQH